MITLIRWILLKQKQIKWKLAIYQTLDQFDKELKKDPDWLAKKVLPYLAQIIHDSNMDNTLNKVISDAMDIVKQKTEQDS